MMAKFGSSRIGMLNLLSVLPTFINFHKMMYLIYCVKQLRKIFRSADDIASDKIEESLRNSIMSIVNKREEGVKIGKADSYGNDFLGSLLKAHHAADIKYRITVDDIVDECKTFYLAGHETISSALTWTILLLAIHADWQEKARNEVFEFFGHEKPKPDCIARLRNVSKTILQSVVITYTSVWILMFL